MIKNKKGGLIGYVFFLISFIFIWIIWLAKYLSVIGKVAIESQGAVGVEAFLYANLNFGVLIGIVFSVLMAGYLSR